MKDFKKSFRGNRSEGGSRGGDRRGGFGGGNRDRRDGGFSRDRNSFSRDFNAPQMHKTPCTSCGKMAEVPFKPTGDKPVLCSDCFRGERDGSRGGDRRDGGNRGDRFGKGGNAFSRPSAPDQSKDIRALQDQIKILHTKMDTVMKFLGVTIPHGEVSVETLNPSQVVKENTTRVKIPKIQKPKPEELTSAIEKALEKKTTEKTASKKVAKKSTAKVAKKSTKKK